MPDVILITYNERLNLPYSLASLQGWARNVFVVDSGSADGTQEVARSLGATVVEHEWVGYARQKNWALDHLPLTSDWVLILDADETITPQLREQILKITSRPTDAVVENGFFINRLTYFLDQPIGHCGYYPSWNLRLFKRGKGRYEDRAVHEHVAIANPVGYIREPMLHNDRRGLEHYFAKHNRYSTLEAQQIYSEIRRGVDLSHYANLAPMTRIRRWLKRYLSHRIPLPGVWRFAYMYVARMGFLDGRVGFQFCKFIAGYDSMVALKLRYLLRRGEEASPSPGKAPPMLAVPEGFAIEVRESGDRPKQAAASAAGLAAAPLAPRRLSSESTSEVGAGRAQWPTAPVSVVILTHNEEVNLPAALDSCVWCDDVHVLDSGSTDRTCAIARDRGVPVHTHAFTSFGAQRNWAIDHIPVRCDWVFHLDADEQFTPELVGEMARRIAAGPAVDGYQVAHKLMLNGRWLKRSGSYPVYQVRLFHKARLRFTDHGHGQREVEGVHTEHLSEPYLHHAYVKGLEDWIAKHNRYSTREAQDVVIGAARHLRFRDLVSSDPVRRRRALKALGYHVPLRPTLRWLWLMFIRGGVLDGPAGWTYAGMIHVYEAMITAKIKAAQRNVFPLPPTRP